MKEPLFKINEETKKKRVWVFTMLSILMIVSLTIWSIDYPFDKEIAIALFIGFFVAFVIKITDWIEDSKMIEKGDNS